ncbi:cellulose synthase subunit BcsC-related outer membrane protein [Paracidobacterium acidisoli]|uniref:Cellulose synthase operon C C-terminal domain-containing protein n=1 Tax=Paracidobacterium acidisoli TaxID=2303751 RepID=A0A372IUE9_9BACT|nr:cellulose synthase subunit BcsC-related outer membrane protein [Paracidobacterium acidisoli]MBT9329996.1 BCSC C-terminal domain-containing protein [Paracidobacterium acidisoli]
MMRMLCRPALGAALVWLVFSCCVLRLAAQSPVPQTQSFEALGQTPAEQAAFSALAAHRLAEAERRFEDLHTVEPFNPRVLAGLGYVHLQQQDFAGAVSYFTQAKADGLAGPQIDSALTDAQFEDAVDQGTEAWNAGRMEQAEDRLRAALALRPKSAVALQSLAGVYMQEKQPAKAIPVYQRLVSVLPDAEPVWLGLFTAQAEGGNPRDAIATTKRFPAEVGKDLATDPAYLQRLTAAYVAAGEGSPAEATPPASADNGHGAKGEEHPVSHEPEASTASADHGDAAKSEAPSAPAAQAPETEREAAKPAEPISSEQRSSEPTTREQRPAAGSENSAASAKIAPPPPAPPGGAAAQDHAVEEAEAEQVIAEEGSGAQLHLSISSGSVKRVRPAEIEARPLDETGLVTEPTALSQQIAQRRLLRWRSPPEDLRLSDLQAAEQRSAEERASAPFAEAVSEGVSHPPEEKIAATEEVPAAGGPAAAGPASVSGGAVSAAPASAAAMEGGKPEPVIRIRNPKEAADAELATIEGSYSPWLGGTGLVSHRGGTPGFDRLMATEAPLEASTPLGAVARVTLIVKPTFLDAGAGASAPVLSPGVSERFGTLAAGVAPPSQSVAGVGEEVQVATPHFAAGAGYTPTGFAVGHFVGRVRWRPAGGPLTVSAYRDSVRDSQLSYAGAHDPGSASAGSASAGSVGRVWGGVVANAGEAELRMGDASSGFFVSGGGQYLTGEHVGNNTRIGGEAGAWHRLFAVADTSSVTMGLRVSGMHYAHNERYFTWGQGGYFSPQRYADASAPVTWRGRRGVNLHYDLTGAPGVQTFEEDGAPYFPLDAALEKAAGNAAYAGRSHTGLSYDFHGEMAYRLTDHWYAGGSVSGNNTRDYDNQTVGFFVRFLFRPQYGGEPGATGLFPAQGLRPFLVP